MNFLKKKKLRLLLSEIQNIYFQKKYKYSPGNRCYVVKDGSGKYCSCNQYTTTVTTTTTTPETTTTNTAASIFLGMVIMYWSDWSGT